MKADIEPNSESTVTIKGYMVFDLKVTEFRLLIEMSNRFKTDILSGFNTDTPERVDSLPIIVELVRARWGECD